MGINKLSGTPWHITTLRKSEEDEDRRSKTKCRYYSTKKCTKTGLVCYGSAHCEFYKVNLENCIVENFELVDYKKRIRKKYIVGIDIDRNDKLVKEVRKSNINDYIYTKDGCYKLNSKNF